MTAAPEKLALRIDDIGASSKEHLYYTKRWYSNFGPLRSRRLFGHWAPYREMSPRDWHQVYRVLERFRAKLTVGITATWVEDDGALVPFPDKFPAEAAAIGEGVAKGLLEVANHGLTHCVLENGAFRRRPLYGTNRQFHREFWDYLDAETHFDHLSRAQTILTSYFKCEITTLIPSGNVYSEKTLRACLRLGLRTVNCERPSIHIPEFPRVIGDDHVIPFHDRELVEQGIGWLEAKLRQLPRPPNRFVRELEP